MDNIETPRNSLLTKRRITCLTCNRSFIMEQQSDNVKMGIDHDIVARFSTEYAHEERTPTSDENNEHTLTWNGAIKTKLWSGKSLTFIEEK